MYPEKNIPIYGVSVDGNIFSLSSSTQREDTSQNGTGFEWRNSAQLITFPEKSLHRVTVNGHVFCL